ncbi:MAG: Calx-beta domain-containing protein [Actinomycetota bacterium]
MRVGRHRPRTLVLGMAIVAGFLLFPATPAFAPCHEITFSGDPYTVGEAAGKVTITVSNGAGEQISDQTIDYETIDGTAKAGSDYPATSGTVTIPLGATEATFDIPITNDTKDESSEQFSVQLSNPQPPSSCAPPPAISEQSATITITDNDPAPQPTPTATTTSPKPKATTPSPTPTATKTPTSSPTPTATSPSPTPSDTSSPVAQPGSGDDGGLSGGAIGGIIAGATVLGGALVFWVRRRFLA